MLVLTGKVGESVKIGDDIEIFFIGTNAYKGQYKVGFNAPTNIPIVRSGAIHKTKKILPVVHAIQAVTTCHQPVTNPNLLKPAKDKNGNKV